MEAIKQHHTATLGGRADVLPPRFGSRSYQVRSNLPASWTRTSTGAALRRGDGNEVSYSLSQP